MNPGLAMHSIFFFKVDILLFCQKKVTIFCDFLHSQSRLTHRLN